MLVLEFKTDKAAFYKVADKDIMKILLLIALTLLTPSIHAQEQAIQEGLISKLFVSNDPSDKADAQRVIVRLEGDVEGGLCPKKVFWQMLLSNQAEQAQYDLLLASYMSGKKVKIWGNKDKHCIHKGEKIRNVEVVL